MEYKNCDLCGSNDVFVKCRVKDRLLGKESFFIVQCKKCGLIYTNPRPTPEEIKKYYSDKYSCYYHYLPESFFSKDGKLSSKLKNRIKKEYLRIHYGYFPDKKIPKPLNEIIKLLTMPVKHKTSWIFPHHRPGGKVLDVGCSTGFYLAKLRELGWDTYGVEINDRAASFGKEKLKLKIHTGTLESAKYPSDYFDAVTLWHCLEHVYSPMNTLKEVYRILKKDGMVIIGTPNIATIENLIFGEWWWAWEVPRHLYHFSKKSIVQFLTKNKFSNIRVEYPPCTNNIIMSLQNYFLDCYPEKEKHIKKYLDPDANGRLRDLLMPLGYILSATKQTGRMIIYAKK